MLYFVSLCTSLNLRLDHQLGSSNTNLTRIEGVHVSFLLVFVMFVVEGSFHIYSGLVDTYRRAECLKFSSKELILVF